MDCGELRLRRSSLLCACSARPTAFSNLSLPRLIFAAREERHTGRRRGLFEKAPPYWKSRATPLQTFSPPPALASAVGVTSEPRGPGRASRPARAPRRRGLKAAKGLGAGSASASGVARSFFPLPESPSGGPVPARAGPGMAPRLQLEKAAWRWTETVPPEAVTQEHIEAAYRIGLEPCQRGACR